MAASVFPDPVGAINNTFSSFAIFEYEFFCMSVNLLNPILLYFSSIDFSNS